MPSTSIRIISKHFSGTSYSLLLAISRTAQWERRALIWPPPDEACLPCRQLTSIATQSHQSDLSSWFTCVTSGPPLPSTEQATETCGGYRGNRGLSLFQQVWLNICSSPLSVPPLPFISPSPPPPLAGWSWAGGPPIGARSFKRFLPGKRDFCPDILAAQTPIFVDIIQVKCRWVGELSVNQSADCIMFGPAHTTPLSWVAEKST